MISKQDSSAMMPVAFFGHGSPMYAIEPNHFTHAWAEYAASIPRPKAVLMISAHWVTRQVWVTAMERPQTIHDFGGFPQALFEEIYPAPGAPDLAAQVKDLMLPTSVILEDQEWGLDHGAWAILKYMYPKADVPVIQMSLDARLSMREHYQLAKRLSILREQGVLILGSGNVVHNLRTVDFSSSHEYAWAQRFNEYFKKYLLANRHDPLIDALEIGEDARLSIPTPEHYWPALYILGLQRDGEHAKIITDGIDLASISMLSFAIS
jgi:4,5-DOPA dioxygenase extradiol